MMTGWLPFSHVWYRPESPPSVPCRSVGYYPASISNTFINQQNTTPLN